MRKDPANAENAKEIYQEINMLTSCKNQISKKRSLKIKNIDPVADNKTNRIYMLIKIAINHLYEELKKYKD